MKIPKSCFLAFLILCGASENLFGAADLNADPLQVYQVNKKVSDFPDKNDFSSPEATYCVINRIMATGNYTKFAQISVKELAERMLSSKSLKDHDVKPEAAEEYLNALILEVRIFRGIYAGVIARLPSKGNSDFYDLRFLRLEDGRWLNRGGSIFKTLEQARDDFARSCTFYFGKPARPKIEDPESYIKTFVEFLREKAEEPATFVIRALSAHKLVIMGETHHRPRYWAFNSSLLTDPNFTKYVGTIYMELPSNDQNLVNKFLAAQDCNKMPVIEMLRDNLEMGWPDQPMLDFFINVWKVNRDLGQSRKIRIVLVDMQRPWKNIQKRDDFKNYEVDRDHFMADTILADIRNNSGDKRNSLFIVGVNHTAMNLKYVEGTPIRTAGWYLRENLGADAIYTIMQHRCVQTNMGRVDGRLCLGLFDSAFAEVSNKPMAFTLDESPFGEQPYDANPEIPAASAYHDGFNAYLYLGPLETESFSPLIAGFYTDEFVKEIERRYQLMYGKNWTELYGQKKADAETFIKWMSSSWGKPRREWQKESLGPTNAWKYGDNWKEEIRNLN